MPPAKTTSKAPVPAAMPKSRDPLEELDEKINKSNQQQQASSDLDNEIDPDEYPNLKDPGFEMEVPTRNFSAPKEYEIEKEAKKQTRSFSELLASIEMDPKLKTLWKQIYENAVTDRKNAMLVWVDLYVHTHGNPEMHALHGDRIAKYLERMEKANAQLIKLAELVYKVKEQNDKDNDPYPDENAIFEQLEKRRK